MGRNRQRVRASLLPLALLLATFALYAVTAEREAVNTDAYAASAGAWRIATAGTPYFDDLDVSEIEGTHATTDGGNLNGQWLAPSPNGHVNAQRMAGPIIAGVPFYWILEDGAEERDFDLLPGALAASLLSAAAVMLLFLATRRAAGTPLALAGALVFAFATPTWSVSANGLWTHPVTQLGIAGAAYAASRNRWGLAGTFLAIGMFGRPHIALIAAVLGLGLAWSRREWLVAIRLAIPTGTSLALLAAWNRSIHGEWSISGAYGDQIVDRAIDGVGVENADASWLPTEFSSEQLLNYLGFFVSFDRGFLIWTPVVLLFLPALWRARKSLPDWSLWLTLGGVVYTFFQLRLNYFAGGVGFHAYRHGLELITCLAPALLLSAPQLGKFARRTVPVVVAVQIAAISIGATLEAYFVDLEDVWRDNSLWLVLRHNPEVVGGWLLYAIIVGLFVSLRFVPTHSRPKVEDPRSAHEMSHD